MAVTAGVKTAEPLAKHTTYRIGGPATYFIEPATHQELAAVLAVARRSGLKKILLGGGSNILFSDRGFEGAVIRLAGDFQEFRFEGTRLFAGAGSFVPLIVTRSAANRAFRF